MSNPNDPYGAAAGQQPRVPAEQAPPAWDGQPAQPSAQHAPPSAQQNWGGYEQQGYQGYVAPKKTLDLAQLVSIAAWVVLGLFALDFLYRLTQTGEFEGSFADNFFGGMPSLGTGVLYAGILLALGVWLKERQGHS
jgi:hypothetical protein